MADKKPKPLDNWLISLFLFCIGSALVLSLALIHLYMPEGTLSNNLPSQSNNLLPTSQSSFVISMLDGERWENLITLHYSYLFSTKHVQLDLSGQQKKELKIKLTHVGDEIDAAHIDYLAIKIGNEEFTPTSVIDLDNGQDISLKSQNLTTTWLM